MRKDIFEVRNKQTRTVIGLMSGTSADGIDAVLTKITGSGLDIKVEEQDFLFLPFSKEVQERIILVANGAYGGAKELCELANYLGKQYAYACEKLCEKAGIPKEEVDLVGNHGQTVWHMPEQAQYLHDMVRGTLQIGEDSYIASAGCPWWGISASGIWRQAAWAPPSFPMWSTFFTGRKTRPLPCRTSAESAT